MLYLTKLPITTVVFWDLIVAISRLSNVEQAALLVGLQARQPPPPPQHPERN